MSISNRADRRPRYAAFAALTAGLAAALVASLGPAVAQTPGGPESEAPPLYRVELIVFAHQDLDPNEEILDHRAREAARSVFAREPMLRQFDFGAVAGESVSGEASGGEAFGAEPSGAEPSGGEPFGTDLRESSQRDSAPGTRPVPTGEAPIAAPQAEDPLAASPATAPFRFRLLGDEEFELADVRRRLERQPAYALLVHGGWIQEALPPEAARPFDLAYLAGGNPAGTVRLHLSRFAHVTVDLAYRVPGTGQASAALAESGAAPGASRAGQASPAPGEAAPGGPVAGGVAGGFGANETFDRGGRFPMPAAPRAGRDALRAIELGPRYRLNAERRLRTGEVHYIDHPAFGVIIVVRPWEPPVVETTDDASEGLRPAA